MYLKTYKIIDYQMSYFTSLEIPLEIDNYFKQLQDKISRVVQRRGDFLEERKTFHITFLFFGKGFNLTQDQKYLIDSSFNELTEEERKIEISHLEFFNTRRDKLLVCKFKMNEKLKKLKRVLDEKLMTNEKISNYNPHVTLGKVRTDSLNINAINLENKKFVTNFIKYHD